MMVMQSSPQTFPLPASHQPIGVVRTAAFPVRSPKSVARKQVQTLVDTSVSFPSNGSKDVSASSSSNDTSSRPSFARSTRRPREARPIKLAQEDTESKQSDKDVGDESDEIEWAKEVKGSPLLDSADSSIIASPQTPRTPLDVIQFSSLNKHRRARSHFSIPDVVVTSCEEEGETLHYEMKVEPNQRKMSLPLNLTMAEIGSESSKSQHKDLNKAASGPKLGLGFRAKNRPHAIQVIAESDSRQVSEEQRSVFDSSPPRKTNSKDGKTEKRTRKTSLPSLFSRKDREAALSAAVLPPSPTLPQEWQGKAESVSSPSSSASPPLSPALSAGPFSPLASIFSTSPTSSFFPSGSSTQKKEVRAKLKEEKMLMKELEKVDKMVRKHDQKAEKAAKKAVEKDVSTGEEMAAATAAAATREGKAKRALRRITTYATVAKAGSPSVSAKEKEKPLIDEVTVDKARYVDSSHPSPRACSVEMWTDLPSPVEEQKASFPFALDKGNIAAVSSNPLPLKRVGSATQRATAKLEAERASRRRQGSSDNTNNKRRSFLGNSMTLKLDLVEGADVGWEDALDSPEKAKFTIPPLYSDGSMTPTDKSAARQSTTRRMTLLESLYKDIEDMEVNFQRDLTASAAKPPRATPSTAAAAAAILPKQTPSARPQKSSDPTLSERTSSPRTSTSSTSTPTASRSPRIGHNPAGFQFPPVAPTSFSKSSTTTTTTTTTERRIGGLSDNPTTVQRAATLPNADQREEVTLLSKSTSTPRFI